MFKIIFVLIAIFDGYLIGKTSSVLIGSLLGNTKISRALKIILGLFGAIFYSLWAINIMFDSDVSIAFGAIVIFGPIGIFLLALFIGYVINGN